MINMQSKSEEHNSKISISQSFAQQSSYIVNKSQLQTQAGVSKVPFKSMVQSTMQRKEIMKLIELKQQLLVIRQRKRGVQRVPDPNVVDDFKILKELKLKKLTKQKLKQKNDEKKKELSKMKHLYAKSQLQFQQKNQIFKEKAALLRVLNSKMENELAKTKQRYREVQFNRIMVQGIRKLLYYRVCQIFFNDNIRGFLNNPNQIKDEDSIGNRLGYLTLFITLVGTIGGARMWINFNFRGPRSTIKLLDGTILLLHPKQNRLSEAIKILYQQLYQIMRDYLHLKATNSLNFYQLCEQLSQQLLSIK